MIREPLPPTLAKPDEITRPDHFVTTNGYFHDTKRPGLLYGERIHKKAPGHWKVSYNKDLAEKVGCWDVFFIVFSQILSHQTLLSVITDQSVFNDGAFSVGCQLMYKVKSA
jgi:hypothetical protein